MNNYAVEEMQSDAAKLSVCMITYNHAEFVEQAIQSVFSQVTDFPIELVICDDASSDNTAAIIRSMSPPAHVAIKLCLRESNVGMLQNFSSAIEMCSGRYIALLEGDDYWISSEKLQKQVDFLDSNLEFAICYHPAKIDSGAGELKDDLVLRVRDVSDIYELANGNYMHTCSVVFRSKLFDDFPPQFYQSTVGDYFLHMLNAQYGKIKCIPLAMGVYRVHAGGVWSMQPNMDLKILSYLEAMQGCFSPDVEAILKRRHQAIAAKSFFARLQEDGFDQRLQRCVLFSSDIFRDQLLARLANDESKSLTYKLKATVKRLFA
ncbi:MAG: glycosyltransferase [Hydrogenophaga sp.]|nr:glycosyltransferase [Hydrogenophaga sp.]